MISTFGVFESGGAERTFRRKLLREPAFNLSKLRSLRMRTLRLLVGMAVLMLSNAAIAGATWTTGHINNVTYSGENVFIQTDAPLPDNCAGSTYGWLMVPASFKAMTALVTGLWLRGDANTVMVTVFTTGVVGGYCQIGQIDPDG
jgi:hypothetical protein